MEQEVKAEFDGFIGIFENAYDKQYIKELIPLFETSSITFSPNPRIKT